MSPISIELPDDVLDEIARRAAHIAAEHLQTAACEPVGYLTPADAASYLGVSRRRIYELSSRRALLPDGRDGRTPLYTRDTLDRYAREHLANSPPADSTPRPGRANVAADHAGRRRFHGPAGGREPAPHRHAR